MNFEYNSLMDDLRNKIEMINSMKYKKGSKMNKEIFPL
jgi:hypothetical protein